MSGYCCCWFLLILAFLVPVGMSWVMRHPPPAPAGSCSTVSTAPAPPAAAMPVPAPLPAPVGPTPLPVDRFTLPAINMSSSDYLQTWDLIHFWLRSPGISTSRSDSALIITDTTNSLSSQYWEGQLWMAVSLFLRYLARLRQNLGHSKVCAKV
jgi:hypothetical protein